MKKYSPRYGCGKYGEEYIVEVMRVNGISAAGIITADMVKAHKPHPTLFKKALEVSGCTADEVVHIGDSITSGVKGAKAVGIKPIPLDQDGKYGTLDLPVSMSLLDAQKMIQYNLVEESTYVDMSKLWKRI